MQQGGLAMQCQPQSTRGQEFATQRTYFQQKMNEKRSKKEGENEKEPSNWNEKGKKHTWMKT